MPKPFQWLSQINFIQFGFRAGLVNIYGFDRCAGRQPINATNQTPESMITNQQFFEILTTNKFNGRALIGLMNEMSGQSAYDKTSIVMRQQEFEDSDLYYSILMLIVITIAYKVLTYFVLYRKVRSIQ